MKNKDNSLIADIALVIETLFLLLAGIYLLWSVESITTFFLPLPTWLDGLLLPALGVAAIAHLVCVAPRRRYALWSLPLAGVYYLCYRANSYRYFLYLAALTVGCSGINYRKILKTYLLTVGVFFIVTIIAGVSGIIENLVYVRSGDGIRSAWGLCYPTDFASIALYLAMFLWIAWRKLPDWAMLFFCALSILLSRFIAYSSTSFICSIVFFCAILYHAFERRVIPRHPGLQWMEKGNNLLLQWAFPILALAMFGLMLMYDRGMNLGYRLNNLMSNRQRLAVEAWRNYGLKPFGTLFPQIGNGFSTLTTENYNFVDSSYPLILLRYGWATFLLLGGVWCWGTCRAIKGGNKRLALVMGIIAVHSFAEHHFIEVLYNVLLVMPFAAIAVPARESKRTGFNARRIIPGAVVTAISAAVIYVALPKLLSWLKTVYELKGLAGGGEKGWTAVLFLLVPVGTAALAIWALYRLIYALVNRKRTAVKPVIALATCGVITLGGFLYCNAAINKGVLDNESMLDKDRAALEVVAEAATGAVYSGIMPAVYKRSFPEFDYAPFSGEELARYRGITVLMDRDVEHRQFIASNCLYTEISKNHSVYTSDAAVIKALQDAGYHLTGYYSTERESDLKGWAETWGMDYAKRSGLKLSGPERSLIGGPYFYLYGGAYTVTYQLRLPKREREKPGAVCMLQINKSWGQEVVVYKVITAEQFDEDGQLTVKVPFSVADSTGLEFGVYVYEGRRVNVRRVGYQRTPNNDVHRLYDEKSRLVREEYYDTEGHPLAQSGGYYSYDQEYDKNNNITARRFYDENGELKLRADGYAIVRWQYNAKRQVTREEFYDTDEKLVMISSKQAANEREYDDVGNLIALRYYDASGLPTVSTANYHEVRYAYNEKREKIREEYYDTNGGPMAQSAGYSGFEQDFDAAGNITSRRFLYDGEPVVRTDGYAQIYWQYDGMHRIIREEFRGLKEEFVLNSDGQAANERDYDDAGNVICQRYYGTNGEAILFDSGYAEIHRDFNKRKQVVREEYYGLDGERILINSGYAIVERDYNELGSVIEQRHYGTSKEPIYCSDGYFEVKREYDAGGHIISESYYDERELLMPCAKGYAYVYRIYNQIDELTEETFYDPEGELASIGVGYSHIVYDYDENRQLLLTHYLDKNRNQVKAGSAYFHEYLQSLMGRDLTIFIAVKDEATNSLTSILLNDLKELGIQTDLRGRYRNAFYAVITPDSVIEDTSAQGTVATDGFIGSTYYSITSAGYLVGNYSSIVIDDIEYSKNYRGMNIVVYDNKQNQVIDTVSFDTYVQEMTLR